MGGVGTIADAAIIAGVGPLFCGRRKEDGVAIGIDIVILLIQEASAGVGKQEVEVGRGEARVHDGGRRGGTT